MKLPKQLYIPLLALTSLSTISLTNPSYLTTTPIQRIEQTIANDTIQIQDMQPGITLENITLQVVTNDFYSGDSLTGYKTFSKLNSYDQILLELASRKTFWDEIYVNASKANLQNDDTRQFLNDPLNESLYKSVTQLQKQLKKEKKALKKLNKQ